MTKQSGLGDAYWVDGYDLSGDTRELGNVGGGFTPLDSTAINQSAVSRLPGLRDGRIEWTSYFDDAALAEHVALRALTTSDRAATYARGTSLGSPAFCVLGKQINYDFQRAEDGTLALPVNIQANSYGGEWGRQHTAGKRTDTAATNGSSVDWAAAGTFGLQAWLHVFSFTGTDVTIKLQESSDNGAGDPFADVTGGAFTAVTSGPQSQRIQTARNQGVERYLRVVTTTSGGFTSCQFAVVVTVNPVEVLF